MNYLITVSFANLAVSEKSYARLVETMTDDPCRVLLFDNCYPLNKPYSILELCRKYDFEYNTVGVNVGLYAAQNQLINDLPEDCEKVIVYDGDNYPVENNWHKALLEVVGDDVVHSTLSTSINEREMNERGFTQEIVNGYRVKVTKDAVSCTTSAFSIPFLKKCGGIIGGNVYYGGNEIAMKPFYERKKWVFLEDFHEDFEQTKSLHDWQYEQYKLLYAHRGYEYSFDEYLKTSVRNDNLAKQIFG